MKILDDLTYTEQTITETWKESIRPVVSVICITYNQQDYIAQTIESILMQKTGFPFELIIHDDASTDNTKEIINSYKNKFPKIIKTIFQSENQFSKGGKCSVIALEQAEGDYIAFCEGDDYWVEPKKLSLQISEMERNPTCDLSFHPAYTLFEDSGTEIKSDREYGFYGNEINEFPLTNIISKGGNFMPLASIVLKRNVIDELFENNYDFLTNNITHFFYQFWGALNGGALYLPRYMSVYRSLHEGSWSLKYYSNAEYRIKATEKFIESADKANLITECKFMSALQKIKSKKIKSIIKDKKIPLSLRKRFYDEYKSRINMFEKIILFIKLHVSHFFNCLI